MFCANWTRAEDFPFFSDGELYAGVYVDFMGTDSAIFRTLGTKTAMRTDQYNSRWLNGKMSSFFETLARHGRLSHPFGVSQQVQGKSAFSVSNMSASSTPQIPLSSMSTSSPTVRKGMTTSCISSSGRRPRRWARVPSPSPASDASAWCVRQHPYENRLGVSCVPRLRRWLKVFTCAELVFG